MDADGLLEGLNADQRAAVTTDAAPLCILAGAGSGKTRVLTRRIAHRVATGTAEPHRVLALTFTRKAAGELRARLGSLGLRDGVAAGTFHGIALAQLRTRWLERGEPEPTLLDRKFALVARNIPRRSGQREVNPLDAIGEIEWAKARRIAPQDYADEALHHNRRPPLPGREMATVYERYEQDKAKRGLVDFDDLLVLCERALSSDAQFAATQRWRFRHLFVDEFQDVNPLQFALLRAWLGDRTDLCVVGDPRQAIYAWNGADAGYLNQFARHFPGAEVHELRDNYRSTPQILAVANAVIAEREVGAPLRPNRPPGEPPAIVEYADDANEARGIARSVRDTHGPGRPWSDQAVLSRTNAQAALIADALGRVGIPHRVRGGATLTAQPEVKEALRRLRGSRAPFPVALADLEADVSGRFAEETDGGDALPTDEGDEREVPQETEQQEQRRANLAALVQLGNDYVGLDPSASAAGFVQWLNAAARSEDAGGGSDAVEVATFHAAKGLEWPIVHVAGVEAGLVPIGHAKTPDAEAEERRLFYVALTRAERVLRLSWAAERTFGSRRSRRQPSPYLLEVRSVLDALAGGREPVDSLTEVRKERQLLAAQQGTGRRARGAKSPATLSAGDAKVFDALKAWRLEQARAASVPAYVVFPDRTLEAMAVARPRDIAGLLSLPGVGQVKATRYGETLLAVVAEHADA
ncbi:MAG: ATP-dependent DNA helicase UvrD2 [Acidimicrobiales bacterium]|nr:ATP-dependent DNA helicase UvrD2 [Acidimicrobiales bacterium]